MRVIYKYQLEIKDFQEVELPSEHRILSVQNQNGTICLWAVVDDQETSMTKRRLTIIPTGVPNPDLDFYLGDDIEYIATVQLGPLVFHVFIDL